MQKQLPSLVVCSLLLFSLAACGIAPAAPNSAGGSTSPGSSPAAEGPSALPGFSLPESYVYTGETERNADGRTFLLEDLPQSAAEELVAQEYMYTITAEFEKKSEILADTEAYRISVQNEQKNFAEGIYTQAITIHNLETLLPENCTRSTNADGTPNPLYFADMEQTVAEYALEEYAVVRVEFTQILVETASAAAPQWGSGTYTRNFLVGQSAGDSSLRIYAHGMM